MTTQASPEQVRAAFTDFTERRLEIWHRTLDPKRFEVRGLGEDWAVAREATPRSPFWVVARYDWSDPAVIRTRVEESSYGGTGDGTVRIAPTADGGSRLEVEWQNPGARSWQKLLLTLMHRGPMGRLVARMWASSLDDYARADDA